MLPVEAYVPSPWDQYGPPQPLDDEPESWDCDHHDPEDCESSSDCIAMLQEEIDDLTKQADHHREEAWDLDEEADELRRRVADLTDEAAAVYVGGKRYSESDLKTAWLEPVPGEGATA